MQDKKHGFETLAIHAGQKPDPISGAVMPPIVLSSTFAQKSPGVHSGFEYARTDNPTRQTLEACIAALEHAEFGIAFGSGCAASTAVFNMLRPGDHIVASDDVYGGTFRILDKIMKPMGIETTWVDMTNLENVQKAIQETTKLIWVETPTNPMLKIVDIEAITNLAKENNIWVGVDNTFATPALQKPMDLGATFVLHSMTKYINGHSDVVGGMVLTSNQEVLEKMKFIQNSTGGILSPFDSFLVLRGVKTLPVRMERHCDSAMKIASWLQERDEISKVYYPGLPNHPNHDVAKKQMKAFGGMISFEIKGGLKAATRFLEKVEVFTLAESLGGVESLIEHPAIMTHGAIPKEMREELGVSDGLIRISVGLETLTDLMNDIEEALIFSQKD